MTYYGNIMVCSVRLMASRKLFFTSFSYKLCLPSSNIQNRLIEVGKRPNCTQPDVV